MVAMAIEFLLCEDVATALERHSERRVHVWARGAIEGAAHVNMGRALVYIPRRRRRPLWQGRGFDSTSSGEQLAARRSRSRVRSRCVRGRGVVITPRC